jgi:hypothetical protein
MAFGPGTGLARAADEPLLPAPPAALQNAVKPATIIATNIFVFTIVLYSRLKRFIETEACYFDPVEVYFGLALVRCFDPAQGNFGPAAVHCLDPGEPYFDLAAERFDQAELYFGPAPRRCFDPGAARSDPATDYFAQVAFDFGPAEVNFEPAALHFEWAEANS